MDETDNNENPADKIARLKKEREVIIEQRDTAIDAGFSDEVSKCDKEIELMDSTIQQLEAEIS